MRHRYGASGLEIAGNRASLIDTILKAILKTSVNALKGSNKLPISLVATGGYGRSLLNPRSDIDILFLLPRASNKLPQALQDLVQDILYLLWDMGFKVGHACRSIAECIEQLSAQDQYIVDALNSEVISLEELGRRLGVSKPHAWRLRNKAYERLKLILLKHPLIQERLGIHEDEADNGGI